jgi:E1-like protein-activating enzyme Gsa7p/Apg7p
MTVALQFQVPNVRVDNSVWTWLSREKLDNQRLSTAAIVDKCVARTEKFAGSSILVIRYDESSSETEFDVTIHNVNTATDFGKFDRSHMLQTYYDECQTTFPVRPRLFIVSFADLKTYTFTYNVAIPALNPSEFSFACTSVSRPGAANTHPDAPHGLTIVRGDQTLRFAASENISGDTIQLNDPFHVHSTGSHPLPFYMRDILTSIARNIPSDITIDVCISGSVLFSGINIRPCSTIRGIPSWAKWPSVGSSLTTIQTVDLRRFLDSATIARDAVQLNIKLIKWRVLPDLDVDRMSGLRCLLIGAGTLGCAVARCLQSWGVSNITFVDCGTVSYSNPARQWLFRLEDAEHNRPKADTAAMRLREVVPGDGIGGLNLAVPLPGHPADLDGLDEKFEKLNNLVDSHDVVFMLTDSRESRWLPSLLVRAKQGRETAPLGLSVALGFDSYLVKLQIPNSACYFCNDINAPSDSTSFRTLDQQCTVTRPGVAAIASCTAVELLASVVQGSGLLGSSPDQVRGFLGNFQTCPATTEPFTNCVCCSQRVVDEYASRGVDFVRDVISDGTVLMRVSGLEEFNERVEQREADIVCWSSDEDAAG